MFSAQRDRTWLEINIQEKQTDLNKVLQLQLFKINIIIKESMMINPLVWTHQDARPINSRGGLDSEEKKHYLQMENFTRVISYPFTFFQS